MANDKQAKEKDKSRIAEKEEKILEFWEEGDTFKKSVEREAPNGDYVFYDGPPFATGLPHHGHILASVIKDAVPRYQTMRGYRVERRWGWDTHGLPIENIVEKNLNISGKKQIQEHGVEKFNAHARSQVLEFANYWGNIVKRIARWTEFDNSYKTMDNSYMESVWWAIKQISKKGLLYEGEKVLPYCSRCETPIANSEIAMDNSYQDISDISVTAKLELVDEPGTFLLPWTTTPWTLPANSAAAVNPELEYVTVEREEETGSSRYVVAKDLAESIFADSNYEIVKTYKGSELVGKSYTPLFPYFADTDVANKENGWKVYAAEYVTTEAGTGVVHLAPAYGEEDMELAKKENIPYFHHVSGTGHFEDTVTDFAGLPIKPKDNKEEDIDHMRTDIEIVKFLAHNNLLFSKQKIKHSYPHCHRCDTPLFYKALSSWFINIQKIKDRLLELNQTINWVPKHLRDGRFHKTAEGAPDWNISRNRFWATPLPIWKREGSDDFVVVGSVDDYKKYSGGTNAYYIMRHGEADHNVNNVANSTNEPPSNLTEKGKIQAAEAAKEIGKETYDLIIASPLARAQQTAHIVAAELGLAEDVIITDDRIAEINLGDFHDKPIDEYRALFGHNGERYYEEKFHKRPPNGENLEDLRERIGDFMYDIDSKYEDKKILIVGHEYVVWMLHAVRDGLNQDQIVELKEVEKDFVETGHIETYDFAPLPHNDRYELDLHRPYVDEVDLFDTDGTPLKRIPEVADCWIESGSMPFAQNHYPFENKEKFEQTFPAQFVAEYIAQTRTWFYYSLVMSTILFDDVPYQNIVTTGNVLAEDGTKMSKSKQNFPDPQLVFDKYGVDAERFYLLSSPVLKSEDMFFSEKGVDEIMKKLIMRLENVLAFYEMYADGKGDVVDPKSDHVLDQWIMSRMEETRDQVTTSMESYEIDRAMRPLMIFVDDLSTWYIRRSRDRFKAGDTDSTRALETTRYVLLELSKLLAPFTPFIAEDVYQRVTGSEYKDADTSVHLDTWPEETELNQPVIENMGRVRFLVTQALESRARAGMKVRQPLQTLYLSPSKADIIEHEGFSEILKEELNVKSLEVKDTLSGMDVEFDLELTDELKEEGAIRDFIRTVQAMRKKAGLQPEDRITLSLKADDSVQAIVEKYKDEIEAVAGVTGYEYGETEGEDVKFLEMNVTISIK